MDNIPIEECLKLYEAYARLLKFAQITMYICTFQLMVAVPSLIYQIKYRRSPLLKRKLKWISKQRHMNVDKHINEVLEVYVAEFAERNNLDWNDYVP